jgi:hypothetical protein
VAVDAVRGPQPAASIVRRLIDRRVSRNLWHGRRGRLRWRAAAALSTAGTATPRRRLRRH